MEAMQLVPFSSNLSLQQAYVLNIYFQTLFLCYHPKFNWCLKIIKWYWLQMFAKQQVRGSPNCWPILPTPPSHHKLSPPLPHSQLLTLHSLSLTSVRGCFLNPTPLPPLLLSQPGHTPISHLAITRPVSSEGKWEGGDVGETGPQGPASSSIL